MAASCSGTLPTHGNASPMSVPVCGSQSFEYLTMGMEEAPDASGLTEQSRTRESKKLEAP